MTVVICIHPTHPQSRLLNQVAQVIEQGGVIVYPTDSGYALGCQIGNKEAVERIRRIRHLDQQHHFTLICNNLSQLSAYAYVSNSNFRLLKAYTPGPYTFILPATKEVPRRLVHQKRKTIGLRVPDHMVAKALLSVLEQPLMSVTLNLEESEFPLVTADDIQEHLQGQVDLIVDSGYCGMQPTSILDLTQSSVQVLRVGQGDVSAFLKPHHIE